MPETHSDRRHVLTESERAALRAWFDQIDIDVDTAERLTIEVGNICAAGIETFAGWLFIVWRASIALGLSRTPKHLEDTVFALLEDWNEILDIDGPADTEENATTAD